MKGNTLTHCERTPMRGVGFYFDADGTDVRGYCSYGEHPQYPYGSLCGDPRTALKGLMVVLQGVSCKYIIHSHNFNLFLVLKYTLCLLY
jgi:hypothetical protein